MAIVWLMEWGGLTPEQYEAARKAVDWEGNVPDGLQYHVAAYDGRAMLITELWESPDHVQPYMDERYLPAMQKLGINTMPRVDIYEVQAIFKPE